MNTKDYHMECVNNLEDDVTTEPRTPWGLLQVDIRDACSWAALIFIFHMGSIFSGTAGRGHLFFYCGVLYLFARWRFPKSDITRVSSSAETSFFWQHVRILIVLAPIFLFSGFVPLFKMYTGAADTGRFALFTGVLYGLGFVTSFGLMVECIVWRSLLNPSAGSYTEQWEQLVAFFRNAVQGTGLTFGFLILDWSWEKLLSPQPVFRWASDSLVSGLSGLPLAEIVFPSCFLFLMSWNYQNYQRWCGFRL